MIETTVEVGRFKDEWYIVPALVLSHYTMLGETETILEIRFLCFSLGIYWTENHDETLHNA